MSSFDVKCNKYSKFELLALPKRQCQDHYYFVQCKKIPLTPGKFIVYWAHPWSRDFNRITDENGGIQNMESPKIAKQIILFNKEAFDNTFNTLLKLQEQAEKMNSKLLDQAVWLPADGKKAINEWAKTIKKGMDEYKKAVDESFVSLQKFFPEEK